MTSPMTMEEMREEIVALHALLDRQADLLNRVAVALKGPEPELTSWDWSDLPEIAEKLRGGKPNWGGKTTDASRSDPYTESLTSTEGSGGSRSR
jgi:hypothetical protein